MMTHHVRTNRTTCIASTNIADDTSRSTKDVLDEKLGGFNASYSEGSVRFVKKEYAEKWIKALITRSGGEVIPLK